jgi:hypothetical protein
MDEGGYRLQIQVREELDAIGQGHFNARGIPANHDTVHPHRWRVSICFWS